MPDNQNWKSLIYSVVEKTDWKKVMQDVGNFLENPNDLNVFTKENVLNLIEKR